MSDVTGIGGVFFRSRDPESVAGWYRDHLGIPVGEEGYCDYLWRDADEPGRIGRTVWSVFPHDTDYFGEEPASFMVNYRVDDLDVLLERLRDQGVAVAEEREEYEFGRFGWITDPEGRRVELWEPAGESPDGHTFLLRETSWRGRGTFRDEEGRRREARAAAAITHRSSLWENRWELEIEREGEGDRDGERGHPEIRVDYRIEPFSETGGTATWVSENHGVGTMRGAVSVVGDTILSTGATEDGGARLMESLVQVGSDAYVAKGALHREGGLVSTWRLRLQSQEPGAG